MGNSSDSRAHIVLVPGFAGFDVLGQLEYFAGITPLFQKWQRREQQVQAVLHYFDNFPTAAVETRAGRLRKWLAKRVARGEFKRGDTLALVGHSTGGLDIRRLLWDLTGPGQEDLNADGARVRAAEIFRLIRQVVFLSVPQWGTNIADWVRTYTCGRKAVVEEVRAAVAVSQLPLADMVEGWIARGATLLTGVGLVRAIEDALSETDAGARQRDPMGVAEAHEAASELSLWLRHISGDFHAIDDLASQPPLGAIRSPAHFPPRKRKDETARWGKQIQTQSYATLGKPPFRFDPGQPAPRWDLADPWTYPEFAKDDFRAADTDIVYRACYRACAGGPFNQPVPDEAPAPVRLPSQERLAVPWHNDDVIELWENDGIVNTASMFWPDARNTVLVFGDHMDIVGHFQLVEAAGAANAHRRYAAYDLLQSESGFGSEAFADVWNRVFDFCAGVEPTQ